VTGSQFTSLRPHHRSPRVRDGEALHLPQLAGRRLRARTPRSRSPITGKTAGSTRASCAAAIRCGRNRKAIDEATAFAVVVSPDRRCSPKWVGKELRPRARDAAAARQGPVPGHSALADGTKLGVLEELFGESRSTSPSRAPPAASRAAMNPRSSSPLASAAGRRGRPPRSRGRAARGARPRTHRPEVPGARRRPPRLGPRAARLRARYSGPAGGRTARRAGAHRAHRTHRGGGTALVPGEIRRLAEPLLPRPRAEGGGEPREVGRLLHEAAMPAATPANVLDAWAKIDGHAGRRFSVHVDDALEPARPRPRTPKPPRKPPRSCSACRGSCCTTANGLPLPGCEADARPPAAAEHGRGSTCRWSPADPHPARHRAAGGRGLRLHRPPRERPAAGRGDGGAPRPGRDPRPRARPRCRLCAPSSTAPAAGSPTTSSTSTATASTTAGRPRRIVLRAPRRRRQGSRNAATRRSPPRSSARCSASTASRSCSWKPARRRRPSRRPSRSPPSCSRSAWPRWWR
jgi:hypothetical protein